MKLIQEVSIWNNGVNKKATILNAYAIKVVLDESATFYYSLLEQNEDGSQGKVLTQGNISMAGDNYVDWIQDEYVWNFIAEKLGLVILGNYVEQEVSQ
jgi:predicted phage tail protein